MNLEVKIRELWAADTPLNNAVPVARVFTGRVPRDPLRPYARIDTPGSVTTLRSDKATERQVELRIQHWVSETQFNVGQDIQDKIEEAFENQDFTLDDSVVMNLHHDNSFWIQDEESTSKEWQFVTQFTATICKDRTR